MTWSYWPFEGRVIKHTIPDQVQFILFEFQNCRAQSDTEVGRDFLDVGLNPTLESIRSLFMTNH
jgi:hypothetical protein